MDELKLLVERQENCKATLRENRVVTRKYEDGDSLTRHIYTFELDGHEKAKLAFVWQKENTVGTREPAYVIHLGIPPVITPELALDIFQARARRVFLEGL